MGAAAGPLAALPLGGEGDRRAEPAAATGQTPVAVVDQGRVPDMSILELQTEVREDFTITEKAPTCCYDMIIASESQFHNYLLWVNAQLA